MLPWLVKDVPLFLMTDINTIVTETDWRHIYETYPYFTFSTFTPSSSSNNVVETLSNGEKFLLSLSIDVTAQTRYLAKVIKSSFSKGNKNITQKAN